MSKAEQISRNSIGQICMTANKIANAGSRSAPLLAFPYKKAPTSLQHQQKKRVLIISAKFVNMQDNVLL